MKSIARIVAILFLSFVGLSSSKASAVFMVCSDLCNFKQGCYRNCSDDITGNTTTCGAYGCCAGTTYHC
jgi:hypothetical protein